MYNYGYNCYTPCAPVAPVTNNCGGGCGGFGGRNCGYSNDCGC